MVLVDRADGFKVARNAPLDQDISLAHNKFRVSAGYGMRFAVRRCAGEMVAMVGDPSVDSVLKEADARGAVNQQRQAATKGDGPRSGPCLGPGVDGT
jgi:hypothetical protein